MYEKIKKRGNSDNIPYGYDKVEDGFIDPDIEAVEALKVAIEYVEARSISLRRACKFLEESTGRSITHEGLRKLILNKTHPIYDR